MSELIVLTFKGSTTAHEVREKVQELEAAGKVTVEDAVVVYRPPNEDRIMSSVYGKVGVMAGTEQMEDAFVEEDVDPNRKKFTRRGGAIGLVAGLVLGGPIGAVVVGAGVGNIMARMKDKGIDKDFVEQIGETLKPDTSAIFLYGSAEDPEALKDELRHYSPHLLSTTLDEEQEKRLRQDIS
jgi:uncharacterized membrane protein